MNDEITSGADILGALIMGHPYNSWWCGSDLSIEESRRLVPHQNATTMQVAISVIAATAWMIQNPEMGVVVPDDPLEPKKRPAAPDLDGGVTWAEVAAGGNGLQALLMQYPRWEPGPPAQ